MCVFLLRVYVVWREIQTVNIFAAACAGRCMDAELSIEIVRGAGEGLSEWSRHELECRAVPAWLHSTFEGSSDDAIDGEEIPFVYSSTPVMGQQQLDRGRTLLGTHFASLSMVSCFTWQDLLMLLSLK